jgi:uncharacterized protein (TIGR03032 family)
MRIKAAISQYAGTRLLDASPSNMLRVPFLHALFPDATFVYVFRDPRRAIHDMEGGDPQVNAREWNETTAILLADLEALPPSSWMVAAYRDITESPETALPRISEFLRLAWDGTLPDPPRIQEVPSEERIAALDVVDEITAAVATRARSFFAVMPTRAVPASARTKEIIDEAQSAFRSSASASFPALLRQLGISLLVSTYQSGRLIILRAENDATLNTHFRAFRSPMGIAVAPGRIAFGTDREIWDYRNQPAVASRLEPPGKHDACYVPLHVHVTGDIRVHEVGFAAGSLWLVNTRFSALCTLDSDSSFVPRWRPPFITKLAAEDRCHLNGMAVIDDRVAFVTALGATDTQGGWRQNKAKGGLLMDVASSEMVLEGLSMPHSPRKWHDRFFLLESGKGTLATADLATRRVETIAELPGFTRGLAFAGPYAFVGLSQVRESNVFGGLPLTERVAERECGIYVVDLRTGKTAAILRFQGDVREIFDIQILRDAAFPEILELGSPLVATSFRVPDASLPDFSS